MESNKRIWFIFSYRRELASVRREASIAQRRLEQEKDQQISFIQ